MSLNAKQKKFAEEIARGVNQTNAAINAGYSKKSAHNSGYRNMKNDEILNYIDKLQSEQEAMLRRRFSGSANIAFERLLNIVTDDDVQPKDHISASRLLLDYAGYKPIDKQETTLTGDLDISQRADLVEKYLKSDDNDVS